VPRNSVNNCPDIVLVSQMFPPAVGGSGELLANVYSRISGPSIHVITDALSRDSHEQRFDALDVQRMTINAHFWGVLDPRAVAQHIKLASILRARSRARPTIIHCGRAQPEGIPALLATKLAPHPKFLFWVHGEEITTALTSRDFAWTMRRVHAGASFAITNSRNSQRVLGSVGFDLKRTQVVYPGVDGNRYHPSIDAHDLRQRFSAPPGQLLLSVGRLQRRKGHDLVLAAMKQLEFECPNLVYVILGDGAERSKLESLTRDYGLTGRVRFEGEAGADQLPSYYAACDVFVLATRIDVRDFEGFGLVFLEAAAAAKPTIGGRNGGVPEAVVDGETGLLVDSDNVDQLAQAIKTLTTAPELRAQLGGAGRKRVERDFTWQRAADAVLDIHREVAGH
jgi:phosphatidyl-myo-inositol dimannoside synthase